MKIGPFGKVNKKTKKSKSFMSSKKDNEGSEKQSAFANALKKMRGGM